MILIHETLTNPFCYVKCGKENTVCKRQPCPLDKGACGSSGEMLLMSQFQRLYMLDLHNKIRNRIALGLESKWATKNSSNMYALGYR